jgi:hypothetical protein
MQKLIALALLTSMFALTGCGDSATKWVEDVNVETANQNDQKWVVTDFQLNLNKVMLPFLTLPLPNSYGAFRMWRLNGKNYMGVDLNLTTILDQPGGNATLPNGQMVPVDTNGVGVIEVEIDDINGKVYVAMAEGMTLVGVAVSIDQLDGMGVGEIGVFPMFNIKGYDVTAGLYTSDESGKTGIAVFANVGSLWEKSTYDSEAFIYRNEYTKRSKKRRVYKKLRRILRKRMKAKITKR